MRPLPHLFACRQRLFLWHGVPPAPRPGKFVRFELRSPDVDGTITQQTPSPFSINQFLRREWNEDNPRVSQKSHSPRISPSVVRKGSRQSKAPRANFRPGLGPQRNKCLIMTFFWSHQRRPRRELPRTDIRRPDILGRHICVRFHVSIRLWWRAARCQMGRMMRACQPDIARSARQSTTRVRADPGALIGRTTSPARRRGVGCGREALCAGGHGG
jgi:hypothetical protein